MSELDGIDELGKIQRGRGITFGVVTSKFIISYFCCMVLAYLMNDPFFDTVQSCILAIESRIVVMSV